MKSEMIKILVISASAMVLQSCSYGAYVNETFTPLTEAVPTCEKQPEQVELYFDGEKTDFDYVKIGLIQIEGAINTQQAELIERFKKLAKSKCANAIIGIKKVYKTREQGLIGIDEKPEAYTSEVFYGIAVNKS